MVNRQVLLMITKHSERLGYSYVYLLTHIVPQVSSYMDWHGMFLVYTFLSIENRCNGIDTIQNRVFLLCRRSITYFHHSSYHLQLPLIFFSNPSFMTVYPASPLTFSSVITFTFSTCQIFHES